VCGRGSQRRTASVAAVSVAPLSGS
jgi:hypothetical protein